MDRYNVASQTVQSAIRQLRAEGLVRSLQAGERSCGLYDV